MLCLKNYKVSCLCNHYELFSSICLYNPLLLLPIFFFSDQVVGGAMDDTMNQPVTQPNVNTQMSKDDIVHLLHLFKEPSVQ